MTAADLREALRTVSRMLPRAEDTLRQASAEWSPDAAALYRVLAKDVERLRAEALRLADQLDKLHDG